MTLEHMDEMDRSEGPAKELPGKRPSVIAHRLAQSYGSTTMNLDVREGDATGVINVDVAADKITVTLYRDNLHRGRKKLDEIVIQTAESFTASRFTDQAAGYAEEDYDED